jgi:hydroxypyruvate reductase
LEAFQRLDSGRLVVQHIVRKGDALLLGDERIPLKTVDQILIVAIGKAACGMYRSAVEVLRGSDGPPVRGIVVSNRRDEGSEDGTVYLRGSHPLPDEASIHAARSVLTLLQEATSRTIVVYLISGGASAMLELPLDPGIPSADMAGFHRALLCSGMPIEEMNTLRKHVSAVKGGRLAAAASAALWQYTLLVSDVPADRPDVIGSGPSLPDPSTWEDCGRLLSRLEEVSGVPESMLEFFKRRAPMETPKAADEMFRKASWKVISSSEDLAETAGSLARQAGFEVVIDNTCDDWEYREAAVYLLERAKRLSEGRPNCCVVSVGEVTVRLPPVVGEGGRNQQFALWCARELDRKHWRTTVLSAGSDGIDGSSGAAGAVCDEETAGAARLLGIDVTDHLDRFDASPLLRLLGAEIVTGPTGNNLRDLRMILFDSSARK